MVAGALEAETPRTLRTYGDMFAPWRIDSREGEAVVFSVNR
jgi:hypothetical protein